jgi:hypothetical protein
MGTSRMAAITYTGQAMNMPYQPGVCRRGSYTNAARPTPMIPRYEIPVIHQSRYNPVARANSLNPKMATAVKNTMTAARPRKSARNVGGIITNQPQYDRQA